MEIKLLNEPLIEFADDFLCEDPKKGIVTTGFHSLSNNSHKNQIQYAVIGTKIQISDYINWVEQFKYPIESTKNFKLKLSHIEIREDTERNDLLFDLDDFSEQYDFEEPVREGINKKSNPDFPGFNVNSCFRCEFLNNDENQVIRKLEIDQILNSEDRLLNKLDSVVELYTKAYAQLIEEISFGRPDIVVIVISSAIYKTLGNVTIFNKHYNLRRKLKAQILALKLNVPLQIILEDTIKGSKKSIQDLATIGWNYCIAQYYKTANCVPWTIKDIDSTTCYLGISFHRIIDEKNHNLKSSIAQAFNKSGKGLVFTGKQFEWNSSKTEVSTPHLTFEYAKELVKNALMQYSRFNKHTPKRVVIHKTSNFWDSHNHPDYDEASGLIQGVREVLGENAEYDLVTIKPATIRLFRNGNYPVIRGTMLKLSDEKSILYTNGYIPYYDTYPGAYVPVPLLIENIGETPIVEICKEILALTKMNFNNSDFCDGFPITLQFSKRVGEIIQYFPDDLENPPNKYFFYM